MFDSIEINYQRFLMKNSFDLFYLIDLKNTKNSKFLKMVRKYLKDHLFDNNIQNSIPIKIEQNK